MTAHSTQSKGRKGASGKHAGASGSKRAHERQHLGLTAMAFEHTEGDLPGIGLECEVFDISRSGAGIRCRKMMYAGRHLFIRIDPPTPGAAVKLLYGEVRYSVYVDRGLYHVGVQFVGVVRSHGIHEWMTEQTHGKRKR